MANMTQEIRDHLKTIVAGGTEEILAHVVEHGMPEELAKGMNKAQLLRAHTKAHAEQAATVVNVTVPAPAATTTDVVVPAPAELVLHDQPLTELETLRREVEALRAEPSIARREPQAPKYDATAAKNDLFRNAVVALGDMLATLEMYDHPALRVLGRDEAAQQLSNAIHHFATGKDDSQKKIWPTTSLPKPKRSDWR